MQIKASLQRPKITFPAGICDVLAAGLPATTVDFGVRLRPQKFRVDRDFWHLHPLGAHIWRGAPAVGSIIIDLRTSIEGVLKFQQARPRGTSAKNNIRAAGRVNIGA